MLTAVSLCFGKLLNPSASERLLFSTPLEASTSLRLCLPHREIDIIVPIVFIVAIRGMGIINIGLYQEGIKIQPDVGLF
jgi:hypothetical protein